VLFSSERTQNIGYEMVPAYVARIEDLGQGDFMKVECWACCPGLLLVDGKGLQQWLNKITNKVV
jgi:hypothetical protein